MLDLKCFLYKNAFFTRLPWQDVCLSVCLSVRPSDRHTPVLCVNGNTYPQSFFTIR